MRRLLGTAAAAVLLWGTIACTPPYRESDAVVIPLPSRVAATMIPTPAPTPAPTPEPTPEPTATPSPDAAACDEFFRDTVFVGDSLTVGLSRFVRRLRRKEGACLDGAAFMAGEGVSVRTLQSDEASDTGICLLFDGERVSVTEGIDRSGKSNVVILLGTNDFGGMHAEDFRAQYTRVLDQIESKCKAVTRITLTAVPPASQRFCERNGFTAQQWNAVNDVIRELCEVRGYAYLSFAETVSDADGYLDVAYSSDKQIHLNENGFRAWIAALRLHAMVQLQAQETAGS